MKTTKANYKLVGYTYRYQVRYTGKLGGKVKEDTGQLVSIQLRNIENDSDVVLSDAINPAVFENCLALMKEHFAFTTSLKLDIVMALNDVIFTFDIEKKEVGRYHPQDSDVTIFCNARDIDSDAWTQITNLTKLDRLGAVRAEGRPLIKWDGRGPNPYAELLA